MRKLSLNVNDLQVESFDTSTLERERGTIRGHGPSESCLTDICGYGCSGNWCAGESTAPCQAGTYAGRTCDTTCAQLLCGCTFGGENNGTCDAACNSAAGDC
jgi:hypothetical protein